MTDPLAPNPELIAAIDTLCSGEDLTKAEAEQVLSRIMDGRVNEPQISAFLIALRAKGETPAELAGLAAAMRSFAEPVSASKSNLVDTAGTGGGPRTFNVSTTAALVAAGAGCAVAKHGNRSATGPSGSADVLEALGVNINLTADRVGACIDQVGFGFMFAPAHHSATRFVVPVRKALATRTAFNLLGPLTNPAGAKRQVVGVSDPSSVETVAQALAQLGATRALVVCSDGGLDEFSISGTSTVHEVRGGQVSVWSVTAEDVGLESAPIESIAGNGPVENANVTRAVLAGELGPARDIAVFNAGAAILAAGDSDDLASCVRQAEKSIDSGCASGVLERLVEFTAGQQ